MSFKDKVTLSFEAVEGEDFDLERQTVEVAPGVRLLRFIALYGANASGKSNLLNVFGLLNVVFFKGEIPSYPDFRFAFNDSSIRQPAEISLVVWNNNIDGGYKRVEYSISFTTNEILAEMMKIDGEIIFERVDRGGFADITISDKSQLNSEIIGYVKYSCSPKRSLINTLFQINIPDKQSYLLTYEVEKFVQNFNQEKTVNIINDEIQNLYSVSDEKYVLDVFRNINYDISDIKRIGNNKYLLSHTAKVNDQSGIYKLTDDQESTGTISFINALSVLNQYISDSQTYLFRMDEPDNNLHTAWFKYYISLFLNNSNRERQMIIATHNAELLDWTNQIIRTDSIWFVDKNDELVSDLYSLADFGDLNKIRLFSKAYLYGSFGAVPKIESADLQDAESVVSNQLSNLYSD